MYSTCYDPHVDRLCEMIDELNGLGYRHRVAIYVDNSETYRSMAGENATSEEIRAFIYK